MRYAINLPYDADVGVTVKMERCIGELGVVGRDCVAVCAISNPLEVSMIKAAPLHQTFLPWPGYLNVRGSFENPQEPAVRMARHVMLNQKKKIKSLDPHVLQIAAKIHALLGFTLDSKIQFVLSGYPEFQEPEDSLAGMARRMFIRIIPVPLYVDRSMTDLLQVVSDEYSLYKYRENKNV